MSTELAQIQAVIDSLGLAAEPTLAARLQQYLDLLQQWNATYNLTSVRERAAMLSQHLADCLAVVGPIAQRVPRGRLLDVGSGGGLPGVVLAAALPALNVTCVDTVGKKAAFVRQVAGRLGLSNLHAEHSRVEALRLPPFDVITSRAFATLETFTSLTHRHLAADGFWAAMKGQIPDAEMAELPAAVSVFHVEQLQVPGLEAQRCLVWMRQQKA